MLDTVLLECFCFRRLFGYKLIPVLLGCLVLDASKGRIIFSLHELLCKFVLLFISDLYDFIIVDIKIRDVGYSLLKRLARFKQVLASFGSKKKACSRYDSVAFSSHMSSINLTVMWMN